MIVPGSSLHEVLFAEHSLGTVDACEHALTSAAVRQADKDRFIEHDLIPNTTKINGS